MGSWRHGTAHLACQYRQGGQSLGINRGICGKSMSSHDLSGKRPLLHHLHDGCRYRCIGLFVTFSAARELPVHNHLCSRNQRLRSILRDGGHLTSLLHSSRGCRLEDWHLPSIQMFMSGSTHIVYPSPGNPRQSWLDNRIYIICWWYLYLLKCFIIISF